MKRILALAILSFSFLFASAQQTQTPVFTKVTATWCPNCGTWGWDFMEEMKELYNNGSEAVVLGVHYSGNLRNPTAEWFADNLNPLGQPVFYVNNVDKNISSNNWSNRIPGLKDEISTINTEEPSQRFSFASAYINENNEIVANVTKSPSSFDGSSEYYFGVYVFENNVEETQSPRGTSSHPNVLRDVMSDNFWGDLAQEQTTTGDITDQYTMTLDANWDANNLGLVSILWKKDGNNYLFENSSVIYNIGLLSSNYELIDASLVNIKTLTNAIDISIDSQDDHNVSLVSPSGQVVTQMVINRNGNINTNNFVAGVYTLHISNGNQIISKQVFVAN